MLFQIRVKNNKILLVKDFIYNLQTTPPHTFQICGVWYGSKDYQYLIGLLGNTVTIELINNDGEVFAELTEAVLDNAKYHLLEDDVDFKGTFKEYSEDTRNIGETYD